MHGIKSLIFKVILGLCTVPIALAIMRGLQLSLLHGLDLRSEPLLLVLLGAVSVVFAFIAVFIAVIIILALINALTPHPQQEPQPGLNAREILRRRRQSRS